MPAKEYNEMRMRGILPSDGMDAIPVTEGTPLTEINSRMWVWDSVGGDWVKSKGNAAGELTVNFATPTGVTESSPLTSIQVEPKANATAIPVGMIPDGATQIAKSVYANDGTVIVQTVTGGTTLYVSSVTLSFRNVSGAGAIAGMIVRNGADVEQYRIYWLYFPDAAYAFTATTFLPPLEIAATWDICIHSSNAELYVYGFVHGYEL